MKVSLFFTLLFLLLLIVTQIISQIIDFINDKIKKSIEKTRLNEATRLMDEISKMFDEGFKEGKTTNQIAREVQKEGLFDEIRCYVDGFTINSYGHTINFR